MTSPRVIFLIGAPRSGTTMLERILSGHSQVLGGPEPHLVTPLAHLGVWAQVDKAPYDHIVAGLGQRDFVAALPNGEQDYWAACRAYCDVLYTRRLEGSGKQVYLDKTPEYATVLPFLSQVYPDARYVVLTRHPIAVLSSFAGSFFDNDYAIAQRHDPVLARYVPALASFLRQGDVAHIHVRYEDLVADPETWVTRIYEHLRLPVEPETVRYGERDEQRKGLGDPIGVKQYARPSTGSLHRWAVELAASPANLALVRSIVAKLDPDDLATLGYPLETFWQPLDEVGDRAPRRRPLTAYSLQRKLIVHGRTLVQRTPLVQRMLRTLRLACDVLLRAY